MDINVNDLKEKMVSKQPFILIDVREQYEFDDFNLKADLIPLGEIMNGVLKYADQKDEEIIIHCRSGKRSAVAQSVFQQNGFTNVRNLEGGILAWIEAYGPNPI